MRVISGDRKGHKLISPKNNEIRPTEDRIKESMFNIIGKIDEDSIVLDLFAGSGSIGIEFLSRGAKLAYFIDKSKDAIQLVKMNLVKTRFEERSVVLQRDSLAALKYLVTKGEFFDYIFIDPPYKDVQLFHKVLEVLSDSTLLKEKTLIIVEHDKELTLNEKYGKIIQVDRRNYGGKCMTYYKLKEVE